MKKRSLIDWAALTLVLIGGLNWGLIGIFDINLVAILFGNMTLLARAIYALVGVATAWKIYRIVKS